MKSFKGCRWVARSGLAMLALGLVLVVSGGAVVPAGASTVGYPFSTYDRGAFNCHMNGNELNGAAIVDLWFPHVSIARDYLVWDPEFDLYDRNHNWIGREYGDGSLTAAIGGPGNTGGNYASYYTYGDSQSYGWHPMQTANTVGVAANDNSGTYEGRGPDRTTTMAAFRLDLDSIVRYVTVTQWVQVWSTKRWYDAGSAVWSAHPGNTQCDTTDQSQYNVQFNYGLPSYDQTVFG